MKVLVTGGTGLTGGAIVTRLISAGHAVTVVGRTSTDLGERVRFLRGDVCDAPFMEGALTGQDALVHVAGITLGRQLADLGALRSVTRVIVISSAAVYSARRRSAAAYRAGEEALRQAHPLAVFLRPTMIYGSWRDRNLHHVIEFARGFGFLPVPMPARALVQPIHFEDLAAAAAALLGRGGAAGAIDAGGDRAVSLRELLRQIFVALDKPARLVDVPTAPVLAVARAVDALRRTRWAERVERLSEDRSVDNGELIRRTGIQPRPLSAGLRAEVLEMYGKAVT